MTDGMFKELQAVIRMDNGTNKLVTGYQVEVDERFKPPLPKRGLVARDSCTVESPRGSKYSVVSFQSSVFSVLSKGSGNSRFLAPEPGARNTGLFVRTGVDSEMQYAGTMAGSLR